MRWRANGRALVAAWREVCVERHEADPFAIGIVLERQAAAAAAGVTPAAPDTAAPRGD